ncbi:MAG: hypothetical protein QXT86_08910 [Archaeoglobaceae archaeon]
MSKRYRLPFISLNPTLLVYSSLMNLNPVESFFSYIDSPFFAGQGLAEGFVLDYSDESKCNLVGFSLKKQKEVSLSFISNWYLRYLQKRFLSKEDSLVYDFLMKVTFAPSYPPKWVFWIPPLGIYIHSLSKKVCSFLNKNQIVLAVNGYDFFSGSTISYKDILKVRWESFVFYCRFPLTGYVVFDADPDSYIKKCIDKIRSNFSFFPPPPPPPPHLFFLKAVLKGNRQVAMGGWLPIHHYKQNCLIIDGYPLYLCELLDKEEVENNGSENDDFENDDFENDDFENDDFENDDFENDDFENDDFENDDFENDETP